MKKLLSLLGIFLSFVLLATPISAQFEYESLYFKNFDVEMSIDDTGYVKVNTKITTMFNRPRHGIFIYLPQVTTMDIDGISYNYYIPIKNFKNLTNIETKIDSGKSYVVRFGSENTYVEGFVDYEYSYEFQLEPLQKVENDVLYLNILGSGWENIIENFSFKVTLPKEIDESLVYLYSGKNNTTNNQKINYIVEGNTITGKNASPLFPNESVTFSATYPEKTIAFPKKPNYGLPLSITYVGLALFGLYWFFRHGKDVPIVKTLEVYPPKGYSSAMVGFIIDRSPDKIDIISLFLEWAAKGYLKIEEDKNDDKIIHFTKLQNISNSEAGFERRLFHRLFNNRDTVSTKELENSFYSSISQAQNDLAHYFSKDKIIYSLGSEIRRFVLALLNVLGFGAFLFISDYFTTKMLGGNIFFIAILITGSLIYSVISFLLLDGNNQNSALKKLKNILIFFLSSALFIGIVFFYLHNAGQLNIYSFIILFCFYIILICCINMSRRTQLGNELLGKIMGLKEFIEISEKDRLEQLVDENPHYFFDILPYAYVLGISTKWAHKFESITMQAPEGFDTTRPFSPIYYNHFMNHSMHATTRAINTIPVSSNTGKGGFSGGGFSGGGFSGGGFSGGGGGGW